MPVRVLMLSRQDVLAVPGGDTVQMTRTAAALERLGVEVVIGDGSKPASVNGFDLVHVFNWQQLGDLRARWGLADSKIPVALSTIFWFHSGHWFDDAVTSKKSWSAAGHLLGNNRARRVYERWQQAKFRWSEEGSVLRRQIQAVDLLLPNSAAEIDHLESLLNLRGRLRGRCAIVPNGVDPHDPSQQAELPAAATALEGRPFVLQAARIQAAKNQLGLLEALMDVPVPVVLAGQPSPYEPEYVARCRQLAERRGNTLFTGALPPGQLFSLYSAAAVHALPSWRETPGLASLEAAAAGCRIVTTSIGSAREYFGEQAWYCHPANPGSIRSAVEGALAAPVPSGLREKVLKRYTWEAAARATLAGYERVMKKSPQPITIEELSI